ncbi:MULTISPECIES: GlxA family transcriptional regulator [unclassified Burkholderia]|uniref:GlxA family transcriptional regulator n=1 Tax=unclassified Burkholderia TaxID=2613784 RepID=UPI00141E7119|nr:MULTISPECIES: GlxA family transcriptional regulator [unclassified Burkholderia]NIE82363.1 GlxA family transcriptional regulator [Burkholderia sp. Tr-860]NIF61649.1 GlxA family transcriptional regulator [Burkholderia sp. Cy-647]NIF96171.1 GlxA family transcriptional regulator [Burkholderia sp. Ax-1720]
MHTVCLIIYPSFQPMSLAIGTVFEYANHLSERAIYEFCVASEHGGSVQSSVGFSIDTIPLDAGVGDTLIVSGNNDCILPSSGLMKIVRQAQPSAGRIASICTGSFMLAEMGLLDGRRATTYWVHAQEFRRRYPQVLLEEGKIYVVDGNIWTSAGMTAGLDLALAMVESDLGPEVARSVARRIVVHQRRGGAQSQFSVLLELDAKTDRIQKALIYAKENLSARLSVDVLAEAASMSRRQFNRVFREETGQSPARAIEQLRAEAARFMLETSVHPIGTIARETGFGDRERMRLAFLKIFGQPPRAVRQHRLGDEHSLED